MFEFEYQFWLSLLYSVSTAAADSWSRDTWGKSLLAHDSHKSWRPLLVFTFRLSHAAAEGFDAAAFHLPSKTFLERVQTFIVCYSLYKSLPFFFSLPSACLHACFLRDAYIS